MARISCPTTRFSCGRRGTGPAGRGDRAIFPAASFFISRRAVDPQNAPAVEIDSPAIPAVAQIPKESVEKVLEATDIVDLIGSYIQLKRSGAQFKANCPFHHEKTPSFYVTPSMQRFKCFGCGAAGDAISFVRDYENLPFSEAVRRLASRAGVVIIEEAEDPAAEAGRRSRGRLKDVHREVAGFLHHLLLTDPAAEHARGYLKSRGFGREMADRWTVGWMPEHAEVFFKWARERKLTGRELVECGLAALRTENMPKSGLYLRFRDRLMFPIRNEIGDVIAFSGRQLREDPRTGKYINSPETAIYKKSNVLFGLERAKKAILKAKAVLLCEGQIDVIACHEAGVEHAVAPLGTALTQQQARLLRRYTSQVLLCYDADAAGIKACERAFHEIAAEGLSARVVEMPAGDDPDTFLKREGVEAFLALQANAREFFEFKLMRARAAGLLESAASRAAVTAECVALLAAITDKSARDHQINLAAAYLRASAASLRDAIALELKRPRRARESSAEPQPANGGEGGPPVPPTPLHRTVAFLCQLALCSAPAQHFLGEQFETLHEANRWLEGIDLLERILGAAPDPSSHVAVNAFMATLPEADRLALTGGVSAFESAPEDGVQAAEHGLALLSATVLQRRDAAVKAALKEPGLGSERLLELLEEAKEISGLLRGVGQRSEFDDELPASTWKEKPPPWKRRV
jgi:DNA primase